MKSTKVKEISKEEFEEAEVELQRVFPSALLELLKSGALANKTMQYTDEQYAVLEKFSLLDENSKEEIPNEIDAGDEEDRKMKEQFAPDCSLEEWQEKTPEEKKMYYLTADRMFDNVKKNSALWNKLGKIRLEYTNKFGEKKQGEIHSSGMVCYTYQDLVEAAYKRCVYPGELTDLDFLDKQIQKIYADNNVPMESVISLRGLHMNNLMTTYVGYHLEQNQKDIEDENPNVGDTIDVAAIRFPKIVDEMPAQLKSETREELVTTLKRNIHTALDSYGPPKAVMALLPLENFVERSMTEYEEKLEDSKEGQEKRAYISIVRKETENEMEQEFRKLNVTIDLKELDWEDATQRKEMIALIKQLQGEGRAQAISELIEKVDIDYLVENGDNAETIADFAQDIADLKEEGIDLKVTFVKDSTQSFDEDMQAAIEEVTDDYTIENRDDVTEAVVGTVVAAAMTTQLGAEPNENDIEAEGQNLLAEEHSEPTIEERVLRLAMAADRVEEIVQELDIQNEPRRLP